MLGFIRKAFRPISSIGRKMSSMFKIGSKGEVISDARNLAKFEDIAPLRMRKTPPSDLMTPDGAFYGSMEGYLKGYKYPN